jgi:hypothetical protein
MVNLLVPPVLKGPSICIIYKKIKRRRRVASMHDNTDPKPVVKVDCPCCGARLTVDAARGVVLESRDHVSPRREADLRNANQLLQEESSRIHKRYQQIVEAEKGRGTEMDRRFKDFLEKAKDEPPTDKPVRDIDLD